MRFQLTWSSLTGGVATVLDEVRSQFSVSGKCFNLEPAPRDIYAITFECEDLGFGLDLAHGVKNHLHRSFGISADVFLNGEPLRDTVYHLVHTIKQAATELKATRSWIKDHRIAETRRYLENAIPK